MLGGMQDVLEQALVMQLADSSNIKYRAFTQALSIGTITDRLQVVSLFICCGSSFVIFRLHLNAHGAKLLFEA